MSNDNPIFSTLEAIGTTAGALAPRNIEEYQEEIGVVTSVGEGVARVSGLRGTRARELLEFPRGVRGEAFSLLDDDIAVMLLDPAKELRAGALVRSTGRVTSIPVGKGYFGRVVDALGRPLDGKRPVDEAERWEVERPAPAIMDRRPVDRPLQTGIQSIDALIPIGRGQRELIVGDRQTGKTAVAVDTMINQRDSDVVCVYCAIGKRSSAVAQVVADLKDHGIFGRSVVVVATENDPPGANFVAAYSATTLAEYFVSQGRDALIVYDDLTRHARSYRELSLLLRRPPAREAYPGDIFYVHSRLLERATQFDDEHGGGSLTALPIVETQEQNISSYIPTNLISITDGQLYLSPVLFQQGVLPPVDIGESVSRVGGDAQVAPYRRVAGDLRLAYSQFEELENFARFGVRLDEETQKTLDRGRRVREVLKQSQYQPLAVGDQIVTLLSVTRGILDDVEVDQVGEAKGRIRRRCREQAGDLLEALDRGKPLSDDDFDRLGDIAAAAVQGSGIGEGTAGDSSGE
ncbi:MAG: F0F1 ATP synthase subunit alpha [Spirochaetaceae bacterium]